MKCMVEIESDGLRLYQRNTKTQISSMEGTDLLKMRKDGRLQPMVDLDNRRDKTE